MQELNFWAEIIRVKTMTDNSIRVELSLSEDKTLLMAELAECKRRGALLDIVATPKIPLDGDI